MPQGRTPPPHRRAWKPMSLQIGKVAYEVDVDGRTVYRIRHGTRRRVTDPLERASVLFEARMKVSGAEPREERQLDRAIAETAANRTAMNQNGGTS